MRELFRMDLKDYDINLKRFLRENSYWYKELNRDPNNFKYFVEDMKIKYKLRTIDKVDNFINSVDLVTKIINASDK